MTDHLHRFRASHLLGGMVLENCQEEGCGKVRLLRYQEPRGMRVRPGGEGELVVACSGTIG